MCQGANPLAKGAVPVITKEQCAAARGLLGADTWTQRHLADKAGLSESSVRNFEKGRGVLSEKTLQAIVDALKAAGVEFIPENGGGPGVRLARRKPSKKR